MSTVHGLESPLQTGPDQSEDGVPGPQARHLPPRHRGRHGPGHPRLLHRPGDDQEPQSQTWERPVW